MCFLIFLIIIYAFLLIFTPHSEIPSEPLSLSKFHILTFLLQCHLLKDVFPDPQISCNFVFLWSTAVRNPTSIIVLISTLYGFLFGTHLPQLAAGSRPSGFIYFTTRCQQNALHIQGIQEKAIDSKNEQLARFH